MTKEKKVLPPKYFVGLHAHSTFSIGDGIGLPQDHIDFAIENGMDALALTDHGNMNGFSHQYLYYKKLKSKGVDFKALPGIEAYFVPSLSDWQKMYNEDREKKHLEKVQKKKASLLKKAKNNIIGNNVASIEDELSEIDSVRKVDEETQGDSGIENEEETKKNRWKNPLFQRNHLVLLPKNNEGLKALFKCVSHSFEKGFYKYPRMDFDLLRKYGNGNIIGMSACIGGSLAKIVFDNQPVDVPWDEWIPNDHNFEKIQKELAEMVGRFQESLGEENYYLELQFNRLGAQHLVNQHLIECANRTGAPLVVTADSHYHRPDVWKEREIYKAMSMLQFMKKDATEVAASLPQSIENLKCELYPKNCEQIWASYKEHADKYDFYDDAQVREAIHKTYDIAHDQIDPIDMDTRVKLPALKKVVPQENISKLEKTLGSNATEDDYAFEQLKKDVISGAKWRGIANDDEYIERLKKELLTIKKLKFAKYFLTYAQIMNMVGEEMLTGTARGSAGGCLVAYVLNITQIDPVKYGLLFERFLTPKKKGFPDIDSDSADRDRAVNILTEYFGNENVLPVSNFNQLQMRSLIKDVCRLNGIPFDEVNAYTKKIEIEAKNEAKKTPGFDAQVWILTFEEAQKNSETFRNLMKQFPDMETTIKVLFKQMRNISRHAGGVIITDDGLSNMPVIKSGGVLQTPWQEGLNFRHLEGFGFLKFDILGLGTLRMFENCIRRILKKQGNKCPTFKDIKEFYYKELHPDNNPLTDMNVYKTVYWNKNYTGIFQFVKDNVQNFMAEMKPTSIIDVAVATSLFRPGPLAAGADKLYLKNRKNPEDVVYKHPLMKEALEDTSGLLCFQEQLQLIYHKLAGVHLDDTDAVRKAFTKKDISNKEAAEKERQKLRNDFMQRCEETNNIGPEVSGDIFDEMEKFVSYSFNKSHAVAYAVISYQCAHLLTYYPDEWVATYIDYCAVSKGKVSGKEDPKAVALSEARGLGYRMGKPDINKSSMEYDIEDGFLIPSFAALKGVGDAAFFEIEQYRPYKSIEDLLWNENDTWKHSKFNKKAMDTLVKMEAMDSIGIVGEDCLLDNYRQLHYVIVENADKLKRAISKKKKTHKELLEQLIEEAKELKDWTDREKIDFMKEISGAVNRDMILTPEIIEYFKKSKISSIDDWTNNKELYWAITQQSMIKSTKTGKKYCRIMMYGESGQVQMCNFWSFKPNIDKLIPDNTLIIGNFKKNNFGLSSFYGNIQVLEKQGK